MEADKIFNLSVITVTKVEYFQVGRQALKYAIKKMFL